jgi:putative transposase
LGIPQALTSDNKPKGHADPERIMRTLKEACLGLQEWTCPFALLKAFEAWIADDNAPYVPSALGDQPPRPFEREYYASHGTQYTAG